jgi:hypothetical protein
VTIKKDDVAKALQSRIKGPCPMCGQSTWGTDDGVIPLHVSSDLSEVRIGGPSIPAVAVVCNHCGFVALHAAMKLGLMRTDGTSTS